MKRIETNDIKFLGDTNLLKATKSTAVSNPVTNIIEQQRASRATDITTLVSNFNELVSKYNAAVTVIDSLREQLRLKLEADRNSGQQAT